MRIGGKLGPEFSERLLLGNKMQRRDGTIGPQLPVKLGNRGGHGPIIQIHHDLDVLLEPTGGGTQVHVQQQKDADTSEGKRRRKNRHHGGRAIGPDIGPGLAEKIEQRSHHRVTRCSGISDPWTSVTTRRLTCVMTEGSCVATRTVVPRALISLNTPRLSPVRAGSRFPVGSSAKSTTGPFTMARAIQTRCCS